MEVWTTCGDTVHGTLHYSKCCIVWIGLHVYILRLTCDIYTIFFILCRSTLLPFICSWQYNQLASKIFLSLNECQLYRPNITVECLSMRHLILQHSLIMWSVTLWNAIIIVGISVTRLQLHNIDEHPLPYASHISMVDKLEYVAECRKELTRLCKQRQRNSEMAEKHARIHQLTSRASETGKSWLQLQLGLHKEVSTILNTHAWSHAWQTKHRAFLFYLQLFVPLFLDSHIFNTQYEF